MAGCRDGGRNDRGSAHPMAPRSRSTEPVAERGRFVRSLRILTWHVHGTYLSYLSHIRHELILPVKPGRPPGYGGRTGAWRWPPNVREVPIDSLVELEVDAVLYQSHHNWLVDRQALAPAQRRGAPEPVVHPPPPPPPPPS